MDFARPQYLVETEWVAQHLGDPNVRVLECTVYLTPKPGTQGGFVAESGRAKWPDAWPLHFQAGLADKVPAELAQVHGVLRGLRPIGGLFLHQRLKQMVQKLFRILGFDGVE